MIISVAHVVTSAILLSGNFAQINFVDLKNKTNLQICKTLVYFKRKLNNIKSCK